MPAVKNYSPLFSHFKNPFNCQKISHKNNCTLDKISCVIMVLVELMLHAWLAFLVLLFL